MQPAEHSSSIDMERIGGSLLIILVQRHAFPISLLCLSLLPVMQGFRDEYCRPRISREHRLERKSSRRRPTSGSLRNS